MYNVNIQHGNAASLKLSFIFNSSRHAYLTRAVHGNNWFFLASQTLKLIN